MKVMLIDVKMGGRSKIARVRNQEDKNQEAGCKSRGTK